MDFLSPMREDLGDGEKFDRAGIYCPLQRGGIKKASPRFYFSSLLMGEGSGGSEKKTL